MCYSHPNPVTAPKNSLYYGDNLDVLQRYVKDESVDLVYLDPPFNSRQDYNVLFAEKDGSQSSSQLSASTAAGSASTSRTSPSASSRSASPTPSAPKSNPPTTSSAS